MAMNDGRKPAERSVLQGRGGAGNFAARSPALDPVDFKTPTIKSDLYTTGRGGTGNMALNLRDFPELARASQDVEAPPKFVREPESSVHYGRGGANVAYMSEQAKAGMKARNDQRRRSEATGVVGQFGREYRENKEKEGSEEDGSDKDKKSKTMMEKGIQKISRAISYNSQAKK